MSVLIALLLAAAPQKVEGRVTSWDAKTGKIHLVLTDHSTGDWTVAPHAKGRGSIHPGMELEVSVTQEGIVQNVWPVPPMWGRPFENGKIKRWDGTIVGFERHDPNFQLEIQQLNGGKGKTHFMTNAKTHWKLWHAGSKPTDASVDDVRKDENVTVLLAPASHQVTEVMIKQ